MEIEKKASPSFAVFVSAASLQLTDLIAIISYPAAAMPASINSSNELAQAKPKTDENVFLFVPVSFRVLGWMLVSKGGIQTGYEDRS